MDIDSCAIAIEVLITNLNCLDVKSVILIMATKANVNTVDVKITSVRVYSSGDDIRYRLSLDTTIDAIAKDYDTDEYVEKQVDYIDFVPRVLIAQCLAAVEGLDIMYTAKKEQALKMSNSSGFGAAELQVVLRDAKVTIERKRFEAGDEYTTSSGEVRAHEYTGYNTDITGIVVSKRIQSKLDEALDRMFDF